MHLADFHVDLMLLLLLLVQLRQVVVRQLHDVALAALDVAVLYL